MIIPRFTKLEALSLACLYRYLNSTGAYLGGENLKNQLAINPKGELFLKRISRIPSGNQVSILHQYQSLKDGEIQTQELQWEEYNANFISLNVFPVSCPLKNSENSSEERINIQLSLDSNLEVWLVGEWPLEDQLNFWQLAVSPLL
jgi:hypothetical protein